MTIPAIGALSGLGATSGLGAAQFANAANSTASTGGADFAKALGDGFDAVAASQSKADTLAVQAATGQLVDPAQYTIAATQASLMTNLATTIESKAVQAFNQIMSMQA